ncbi:MAG: BACON domain-containing protein [Candidatus Symbiothrix sp.]|nr:BACON domain-containing protein [Candidatus Symbiothrix sp.]
MKNLQKINNSILLVCLLLLSACMDLPDPVKDLGLEISDVSYTSNTVTATVQLNNAHSGTKLSEWGIVLFRDETGYFLSSTDEKTFQGMFTDVANPQYYSLAGYAVIGEKTIYGKSFRVSDGRYSSDVGSEYTLSVSPPTISATATANTYTLTVTSNTSWTVGSNASWCILNCSSGTANGTVTVSIIANTGTQRSAVVSFKAGDLPPQQIPVTQASATAAAPTVTVTDFVAISDGIYLNLTPSSNTSYYYWNVYTTSSLTGFSDADIIADLIEDDATDKSNTIGYCWDIQSQTSYTVCIVAYDAQNKAGALVKKEISTKSATNQPLATVTTSSVGNGKVTYSITKNSYCSKYVSLLWYNVEAELYDYPDIYWASDLYEYRNNDDYISTTNTLATWTPSVSGNCAIVTLGFTSSGVYGGVISKKFFNTSTGAFYAPPAKVPASEGSRIMKKMTKAKEARYNCGLSGIMED